MFEFNNFGYIVNTQEENDEILSFNLFNSHDESTSLGNVNYNGALEIISKSGLQESIECYKDTLNNLINNSNESDNFNFISIKDKTNKTEKIFLPTLFRTIFIPNNLEENKENNCSNPFIINNKIFLGKKKNKFTVLFPNEFYIFEKGENKDIRKLINDIKEKKITNFKSNNHLKKRKENADNIRKKIKSRFLKSLKNAINKKLKLANSKMSFDFLPQSFICNISKNLNIYILNRTFEEVFSTNFIQNEKKENINNINNINNKNKVNFDKYQKNRKVLEYIKENDEISEKLDFNIIKDMKFYQIYDEYLRSKEFENEIIKIKKKERNNCYIYNFINLACNLICFFSQ